MTALILAVVKAGLIAGTASVAAWTALYTYYTRGACWKDPLGQTLIAFALITGALFGFQILRLFFGLTPYTSRAVALADMALVVLVPVVLAWRIAVFAKVARRRGAPDREDGKP